MEGILKQTFWLHKKDNLLLKITNLFLFLVKIKQMWFRDLHITQCMTVLCHWLANSWYSFWQKHQCSSRDVYKHKDFYSETLCRIIKMLWMASKYYIEKKKKRMLIKYIWKIQRIQVRLQYFSVYRSAILFLFTHTRDINAKFPLCCIHIQFISLHRTY